MTATTPVPLPTSADWNTADAEKLYGLERWGAGYFGTNELGHVVVRPDRSADRQIDLLDLVDQLRRRDIEPPILIRFDDILRHRMSELATVFENAIREYQYQGVYRCVYPVKVNQQRHVVEEIQQIGSGLGFGLEAGSKPELLAVLAMVDDPNTPIICNGFKDTSFIETALLAQKLGRYPIIVVDRFAEAGTMLGLTINTALPE